MSPAKTLRKPRPSANSVTQPELAFLLHSRTGMDLTQCQTAVDNVVAIMLESLVNGTHVRLRGLGSLNVKPTPARRVRLPHKPDVLWSIPSGRRIVFMPGDTLSKTLRKP
jgi:nucleoid DNA-binding protein